MRSAWWRVRRWWRRFRCKHAWKGRYLAAPEPAGPYVECYEEQPARFGVTAGNLIVAEGTTTAAAIEADFDLAMMRFFGFCHEGGGVVMLRCGRCGTKIFGEVRS